MGEGDPGDAIGRFLDERLDFRDRLTDRLVPALCRGHDEIAAVVLYGSRLGGARRGLAAPDSEPDFFVVVDSLARYHRRLGATLLGRVLPPSVYHARLDGTPCKLCVIESGQLRRETSRAAGDLHHLGRFSKRIGLVHARDADARRLVLRAARSSLEIVADHALALLGERFRLRDFLLALLRLSYRAEPRIVEAHKAEALYAADRDHYRTLGRLLLAARPGLSIDLGDLGDLGDFGDFARSAASPPNDRFRQPLPPAHVRAATLDLIRRSRVRELVRWPKYLVTFDGWLDYLLRKLARHGHHVDLGARQRRHPLVFGLPTLLALRRQGVLR